MRQEAQTNLHPGVFGEIFLFLHPGESSVQGPLQLPHKAPSFLWLQESHLEPQWAIACLDPTEKKPDFFSMLILGCVKEEEEKGVDLGAAQCLSICHPCN